MGTKKGQVRKTARRAYKKKYSRPPRKGDKGFMAAQTKYQPNRYSLAENLRRAMSRQTTLKGKRDIFKRWRDLIGGEK